jgi:membrane dipeptidase
VRCARNLNDDQLRGLAAAGGVLGIMHHPICIDHEEPTIDRVVDHVEHAVEVMGFEHVGLGSDFTRQTVRAVGWDERADALLPSSMAVDAAIDGLAGPEDFPNLVRALRQRGFEGSRLRSVLGGNLLRVFREALPG